MGGKIEAEGGQAWFLWAAGPLSGVDGGAGGVRRRGRRSSSLPMLSQRLAPRLGLGRDLEAWPLE